MIFLKPEKNWCWLKLSQYCPFWFLNVHKGSATWSYLERLKQFVRMMLTDSVMYDVYIIVHIWTVYICSPIRSVHLFFIFFWMMQWIQSSKKVWINRETADAWQHICYSDKKNKVHWQGFTAIFAFPACLCLVLSPLTGWEYEKQTNKNKQMKTFFLFFSILWLVMGAYFC